MEETERPFCEICHPWCDPSVKMGAKNDADLLGCPSVCAISAPAEVARLNYDLELDLPIRRGILSLGTCLESIHSQDSRFGPKEKK